MSPAPPFYQKRRYREQRGRKKKKFERGCSHIEILTDRLFLLARRVRVAPEERVERLELVARHAVSGTRRRFGIYGRYERERGLGGARRAPAAAVAARANEGRLVILKDERGGWRQRQHGEAAHDRRRRRRRRCRREARSGRRTRVHFGIVGGSGRGRYDGLGPGLGLGRGGGIAGL